MRFATEKETTELDSLGSTVTIIRKVNGEDVNDVQKQYRIAILVHSAVEEKSQYDHFTAKVAELRATGRLVVKDKDPASLPSFSIEYPKSTGDGSYLVIKTWTERTRVN
jgi:hypothetical protein